MAFSVGSVPRTDIPVAGTNPTEKLPATRASSRRVAGTSRDMRDMLHHRHPVIASAVPAASDPEVPPPHRPLPPDEPPTPIRPDPGRPAPIVPDPLPDRPDRQEPPRRPIVVDGGYGPNTESATVEFQESVGSVDADGVAAVPGRGAPEPAPTRRRHHGVDHDIHHRDGRLKPTAAGYEGHMQGLPKRVRRRAVAGRRPTRSSGARAAKVAVGPGAARRWRPVGGRGARS